MKKIVLFSFVLLFILLIGTLVGGFLWWQNAQEAPNVEARNKRIVIEKGSSAAEIAKLLKQEGIIKNELAFRIYARTSDLSGRLQAGEFNLPVNKSLPEVTALLLSGPTEIWVTIPEGLRREQIALRFASSFGLEGEAFDEFVSSFMDLTVEREGMLFPDTYLIARDATPERVVSLLSNTFDKRVTAQMKQSITSQGRTLNEALTLASIIERETKNNPNERAIVAGILLKRIEAGWPIQADATLQYALGSEQCTVDSQQCDWWIPPTAALKESLNSPYNTYKNQGLPPAPIASPGLSSIEAAINPAESDYWFYIHDDSGKIYYARTLEEHNQNIARYL